MATKTIGRNDPCPCGTGRKYKRCCLQRQRDGATHVPVPQAVQTALDHHRAGRLPQAEAIYRQVLQVEPNHPDALHLLGVIEYQAGNADTGVDLIQQAIKETPSSAVFHIDLGNALRRKGKFEDAVDSYRRALSLKPDDPKTHNNLGNVMQDLRRLDEAAACYHEALLFEPDLAEAHNNLGSVLQEQGKLDEAAAAFLKALSLKPDYAEAYNNLGTVFQKRGRLDKAAACRRKALSLKPDLAKAHNNLGSVLQQEGKLGEAIASYRSAIASEPNFVQAHNNLGSVLLDQGNVEDAAASFQRALTINPNYVNAHTNLLCLHGYTRDISPESERLLAEKWEKVVLTETERVAARDRARSFRSSPLYRPRVGRRLRLGVVSAELGQHSVAEFLEPLLEQLDRSRFHLTLFSTDVRLEPRAARIKELADVFEPFIGLSDKNAADQVRSGRIDVLVDTSGFTNACRLGIFAHRAAPVQCHYIGYFGTTGLTEMDWFVADGVLLPSSCDAQFREGIWRLPRLWISYRGDTSLPDSRWSPTADGTIWLGTFNNLIKVRGETLSLWAKIMKALPESRLLLKDRRAGDPAVQERIRNTLLSYGIGHKRVHFAARTPDWTSHMTSYDRLDIALDTIPLNSGTTAFDALWMGVPIVALEGNWMGGRMTTAILTALGRPEWIAQTDDEYVSICVTLARNVEARQSLRANQRALMASSPLCDAKGLARSLENAFEAMFDQWLAGERS